MDQFYVCRRENSKNPENATNVKYKKRSRMNHEKWGKQHAPMQLGENERKKIGWGNLRAECSAPIWLIYNILTNRTYHFHNSWSELSTGKYLRSHFVVCALWWAAAISIFLVSLSLVHFFIINKYYNRFGGYSVIPAGLSLNQPAQDGAFVPEMWKFNVRSSDRWLLISQHRIG